MERTTRIRIKKMLGTDKEQMNEGSKLAAKKELGRVLREFFDLEGEPSFELSQDGNRIEGELRFHANRAKNFTLLS